MQLRRDFQTQASPVFSLPLAAMPPVQSRFAAAGLVAGLAASAAFVAPSSGRADSQLRGGVTSKAHARTPVSQEKSGDGLAALAVLGAGLAAVRGSRTQAKAAAAVEAPEPALFQPSEQFGATQPLGFFDPLGFTKTFRLWDRSHRGAMAGEGQTGEGGKIPGDVDPPDTEGPMPGESAETLDDLRQECAVLRQRVAGLEAENVELQALVREWRQWYSQSYKPQIEFLDNEVSRLVAMAPNCGRLAANACQDTSPGSTFSAPAMAAPRSLAKRGE
eukprot:s35_g15.t1